MIGRVIAPSLRHSRLRTVTTNSSSEDPWDKQDLLPGRDSLWGIEIGDWLTYQGSTASNSGAEPSQFGCLFAANPF